LSSATLPVQYLHGWFRYLCFWLMLLYCSQFVT